MSDAADSLLYAVRPAVLRYYLSRLSLALAALTLVPLCGAMLLDAPHIAGYLGLSLAAMIGLWLLGRGAPVPQQVQENEALVVVALTFVLTPVILLPAFVGGGLPLVDAFFESVSAVTTTGLSTVPVSFDYPPALLLLRAWMQWFGGLGIAVFSVALLFGHHPGVQQLAGNEVRDSFPASTRTYAREVLTVYIALTALATAALWFTLGDGLEAFLHALTSISTGGFSGYERSLADMPTGVAPFVTIGVSLLGALPLVMYYHLAVNRRQALGADPEWWTMLVVVVVGMALLSLILYRTEGMSVSESLYHGVLLAGSAQTTAGFSTLSVGGLGDPAKLLLVLAMLSGGSVGSTAGGIKLLRLLLVVRVVSFMVRRTAMPSHAVAEVRLAGRKVAEPESQRALVVVLLFLLTVLLSWLAMVAGGHGALDALFDVVSATATVGLSAGITSEDLDTSLKLLLCADMLAGRLEILALLVLLYPRTWLGRRIESR